ncbi:MAG: response regulator transcription factor [Thiotrichales bacterium]|nr:response regulator transcription factor [Thiotrichales bacterium]
MLYSNTNILIIDDHTIVVDGCAALLKQSGFKHVTVATDCDEALQYVLKNEPELIIVDISMPGMGGLGVIRRIRKKKLDTKVIVFSMHDDPSIISRAIDCGVMGYITKTTSPEKIVEAVKQVLSDQIYLSQDVAQTLALDKLRPTDNILDSLSPKEYEIFDMLVNGNTVSEIATTLFLSSKSVSNYITKIKTKLDTKTMAELVHLGIKYNIARIESNPASR